MSRELRTTLAIKTQTRGDEPAFADRGRVKVNGECSEKQHVPADNQRQQPGRMAEVGAGAALCKLYRSMRPSGRIDSDLHKTTLSL